MLIIKQIAARKLERVCGLFVYGQDYFLPEMNLLSRKVRKYGNV